MDEWPEEPFNTKMTIPDFPPPYFIDTAPTVLNGDLPPKKRRLLADEDMRESIRSNQEEGIIGDLFFNFRAYEEYSKDQQPTKTAYNNSVISSKSVNAGQGENVSMVIHDAEDDAPPSQRRSVAISQSPHKRPKFKYLFY